MKLTDLIPFNRGNRKTQLGVALFVILFTLALARWARADEPYVQMGVGSAIVRGEAPLLDLSIVYPGKAPRGADYTFGVTLIGESDYGDRHQRGQIAWRAQLVDGFGKFDLGLGAAYLQNEDIYNSCHLEFSLSAAYRFKWGTLEYLHFSNAGTCMPNVGRDLLFWAHRF